MHAGWYAINLSGHFSKTCHNMTFTKRKLHQKDAADKPKKLRVVSVRLTEEEYQQVVENCRKAGRKIVGFLGDGHRSTSR